MVFADKIRAKKNLLKPEQQRTDLFIYLGKNYARYVKLQT